MGKEERKGKEKGKEENEREGVWGREKGRIRRGAGREMFSQNFILFSYYLPRETRIYRQPNLWAGLHTKNSLTTLWLKSKHFPLQ